MESNPKFLQYTELGIILFLHLMNHILMFSLPVLILFIRDEYYLNYTQSGLLWTMLIVIMTTSSIGVGLLSDGYRRSRYILIFIGLTVMTGGWFLITFATSFLQLLLFFAVIGLGASGFHPPAMAMITELFENDKGKALSLFQAVGMGGTSVSPLIFAGIGLIVGNWISIARTYFIIFTIFVIFAFLVSIVTGMFDSEPIKEEDLIDASFIIGGEKRSYDLSFLLSPLILIPLLFISIRSSFFRTSSLFTSLLFEDYLFLTKSEAAVATAVVLGIASMFTLVGGTLSDRTRPSVAILTSSIGSFLAASLLVFFTNYNDIISFGSFYFFLNAFYYIGSPATSALLADRVAPEQRGKMFGSLFSIGQILSLGTPIIFGVIRDNQGLRAAFQFILILAAIALFIGGYIFFEERSRTIKSTTSVISIAD